MAWWPNLSWGCGGGCCVKYSGRQQLLWGLFSLKGHGCQACKEGSGFLKWGLLQCPPAHSYEVSNLPLFFLLFSCLICVSHFWDSLGHTCKQHVLLACGVWHPSLVPPAPDFTNTPVSSFWSIQSVCSTCLTSQVMVTSLATWGEVNTKSLWSFYNFPRTWSGSLQQTWTPVLPGSTCVSSTRSPFPSQQWVQPLTTAA